MRKEDEEEPSSRKDDDSNSLAVLELVVVVAADLPMTFAFLAEWKTLLDTLEVRVPLPSTDCRLGEEEELQGGSSHQ